MLAIVDNRIPNEAKIKLSAYADIIELETEGVTFDYLSGHPDVFFCRINNTLVYSPNTPRLILEQLKEFGITLLEGILPVENRYPGCARYNAVVTEDTLIHNSKVTDKVILDSCKDFSFFNVKQGLTRCSLLAISSEHFITSDAGIHKTLVASGKVTLLISDKDIILNGLPNGLFGGTCGLMDGKLFLIGSLRHYSDSEKLKPYLDKLNVEIIELYDGPLFDGGSILFLPF
ncbi:MAG: hypothetical protein KKA84_10520 [Bacteroidetes bacterium]|nr:hypothetical protein [Bacteroidota bacterium]